MIGEAKALNVLVTLWDQSGLIYAFHPLQILPQLFGSTEMGGIPMILLAPN